MKAASWIWSLIFGLFMFALVLNLAVGILVAALKVLLPFILVGLIVWLLLRFGLGEHSVWLDEWFGRW